MAMIPKETLDMLALEARDRGRGATGADPFEAVIQYIERDGDDDELTASGFNIEKRPLLDALRALQRKWRGDDCPGAVLREALAVLEQVAAQSIGTDFSVEHNAIVRAAEQVVRKAKSFRGSAPDV